MSYICAWVETCCICSFCATTLSRTKWMPNSICFVRACKIGLCDNINASRLSQIIVGDKYEIFNSFNKDFIHKSSYVAWDQTLYSAFVLERATNDYFFELHMTRFDPKYTYEPVVDCLSAGSLALSDSLYAHSENICIKVVGVESSPWVIVPLKHLICFTIL